MYRFSIRGTGLEGAGRTSTPQILETDMLAEEGNCAEPFNLPLFLRHLPEINGPLWKLPRGLHSEPDDFL